MNDFICNIIQTFLFTSTYNSLFLPSITSTRRLGSHSTSDDQSLYQDMDQVGYWSQNLHPTSRLKLYMMNRGLWDEGKEKDLVKRLDKEIKACYN